MTVFGLSEFVERIEQKGAVKEVFNLESPYLLAINLSDKLLIKVGAMVAYRGEITFGRESDFAFADGKGLLFCADQGRKINIINLNNETLYVQGNSLLAFEKSINYEISFVKKQTGLLKGGLHCVKLEGAGKVAVSTYNDPVALKCTSTYPVHTDPDATVAWSGSLYPEVQVDTGARTLFRAGGSGEVNQYHFQGDGFVVIQAFEESSYAPTTGLTQKT